MLKTAAYAAQSATSPIAPFTVEHREPETNDVLIDILFSGVCHSDIHQARNEWGNAMYPMVPGHEIVGRVVRTGSGVTKYKAGDMVGVGCLVDSCRACDPCHKGLQQYCEKGLIGTYNCVDPKRGTMNWGGYATQIVVDQDFVVRVPDNLDPKAAAPLLCAGITTYSPLKHWKVGPGQKVGIIGLGGLGHMGVKFAHAMGARVVMITTSPEKGEDAKKLGADEVLISKDEAAMAAAANSFDFLLDTIPVAHDLNAYTALLKLDATLVLVGPLDPLTMHGAPLILKRRNVAGSVIGGLPETQEMLDFCGKHNIVSEIETIAMQDINDAYARMLKSDVKYRFVIDIQTLKDAA